ncbi:MAG: hypothetical protein Q4C75_06045, partial [Bergeyella zoohelcum]|nr:hypothetical protein [Bergeyella zoohelcum]
WVESRLVTCLVSMVIVCSLSVVMGVSSLSEQDKTANENKINSFFMVNGIRWCKVIDFIYNKQK